MKIHNKRELQQIAINHLADIDYKDFMKIYRNCTKEPYSFLTTDTTLPANNPLKFIKFLMARLKQIKLSIIYIEKALKYPHYQVVN